MDEEKEQLLPPSTLRGISNYKTQYASITVIEKGNILTQNREIIGKSNGKMEKF